MVTIKKANVRRTRRTDGIISLKMAYEGSFDSNPHAYNSAYAEVLRHMADAIANVKDAWVDPEVVVWMHRPGVITSEVMLSDPVTPKKRVKRT